MVDTWSPMAVLPNIEVRTAIDTEHIALVSGDDHRVKAFTATHDTFPRLLAKFTDQFGRKLDPGVLIVRDDVVARIAEVEPLSSFLDLVAMSVVPYRRAHVIEYPESDKGALYTNSFHLYPWMLDKNYKYVIRHTPAVRGFEQLDKFQGQSSPETTAVEVNEVDIQLFRALVERWEGHYLGSATRWAERALFRSLNMAFHAALVPANGSVVTLYDLGRQVALWVSAFEILAHSGNRSGPKQVVALLRSCIGRDTNLLDRACILYGRLYDARNNFLHGNPVGISALELSDARAGLFWLPPCLYRLGLAGFLKLENEGLDGGDMSDFKRKMCPITIEAAIKPKRTP